MRDAGSGFNPHTHAGCDKNQHLYLIPQICFNPHTHAGCDRMEILENVLSIVSIHTPTQGVTVWTQPYTYRTFCFNPHTHAGCDGRFVKGHNYGFKFQSTHPRRV